MCCVELKVSTTYWLGGCYMNLTGLAGVRGQKGCLLLHYGHIECSFVNSTVLRVLRTFIYVAQQRNSGLGCLVAEVSR